MSNEKTTTPIAQLQEQSHELMQSSQASAQQTKVDKMAKLMVRMRDSFEDVLQREITTERFTRLAIGAFRRTPKLRECTELSIVSALMDAAAAGLEPNTPSGECWLIPRTNRGVLECTLQIGYQGWLKMLHDSGVVVDVCAKEVLSNDFFEMTEGANKNIIHKINIQQERGELLGVYALIRVNTGGVYFDFMTVAQIEAIRARANEKEYSAWKTDWDMMSRKTVLKRVTKYMAKSSPAIKHIQAIEQAQEETPQSVLMEATTTNAGLIESVTQ